MDRTTEVKPALYVGTYGKYNDGSIAGKWLELENYETAADFFKACAELHKDEADPEYMFQDFEGFPREFYGESLGMDELQQLLDFVHLPDDERTMIAEYADATGERLQDITLEQAQDAYVTTLETTADHEREYGEYVVDNDFIGEIPEALQNYLNYEAIGRDFLMDCYISSNGYVFTSY